MSKRGRWLRAVTRWTHRAETKVDSLRARFREKFDKDPLMIQGYLGFGTDSRILVRARVLEDKGRTEIDADASAFRNFRSALNNFLTSEIAHAKVELTVQGETTVLQADDEGYIAHWVDITAPLEQVEDGIAYVSARLLYPERPEQGEVLAELPIYVPPADASFMVVSDIDDTILRSNATQTWTMMRQVLFENAHTRLPFRGVAELYQALTAENQPIFYVSSSPWNLYDMLTEFMDINEIPVGPITLRDWGITDNELLPIGHGDYKINAFRQILDAYPDMPLVLLGDSGQEDPEIYQQIVVEYPTRVLAIYIRHVNPSEERDKSMQKIADALHQEAVDFVIVKDSLDAAQHARSKGWIDDTMLAAVRDAKERQS